MSGRADDEVVAALEEAVGRGLLGWRSSSAPCWVTATHLKAAVEIFADIGAQDRPRPEIWKLVQR